MVNKALILVCFLILLSGIGIVSAYDQVETYSVDVIAGQAVGSAVGMLIHNIALFSGNITRIELTGTTLFAYNTSVPTSGSYMVGLKERVSSVHVGNGTFSFGSCDIVDHGSYNEMTCAMSMDIIDFDSGGLTGAQVIVSETDLISNFDSETYVYGSVVDYPENYVTFTFNAPYMDQSATGTYTLYTGNFTPSYPLPTLTPTPAPTIPPGYIRTYLHVWDQNGNHINGADIQIKDVEANTWTNSTDDADGILYIDTLQYHTLNFYGSYDTYADVYTSASLLGQETGYTGGYVYYLTLFPSQTFGGLGETNLYVEVKDASTHNYIRASVNAAIAGGYTLARSTDTGITIFVVPNNTIIRVSASSVGYDSATTTIDSEPGTIKSVLLELSRATVTTVPTGTVPPGGVTIPPTQDPNDPAFTGSTNAKGQEILNWLAMNGMDLVQLCFLITMLALLGFKFGK